MDQVYDIIIIGSGLGGLECGVMLSKEGYNVCVLEQSSVSGGCLQSFCRRGKTIDTGIHYIGSMGDGQIMRQYLKYFGIFDKLSTIESDKDFEVIKFGEQQEFSYKHGYDSFMHSLIDQFPKEQSGLKRYCEKIKEIGSSINIDVHRSGKFSSIGVNNLSVSAEQFIGQCVTDPTLRNLLAGTNVLYGGVKDSSNLYHHAMINHSNIEGAYRIVGGSQNMADLLVKQIVENGGKVSNNSKVININADGAEVKSVKLENGDVIFGKYFISNIHPVSTFEMLSTTDRIKKAYKTRLSLLPNTYGLFSVYMLMKPNSFKYLNNSHYYYHSKDAWDSVLDNNLLTPKLVMLNTQLGRIGDKFSDVVTLMSPIDLKLFEKWGGTTVGNRGEEYAELKNKITNNIIEYTSRITPNINGCIDRTYSASPLTFMNYTGTPQGSAYGIQKDYKSMITSLLPVRTKLNNLFLTGQNINVHGALGVTLTAATTCAEIIGTEYLAKKIGDAK